jgi:O-antigen chain-terminating methyltransferase
VGHVLAYAKRVVRLLLRWYINPIVEQQNLYNSAVARTLVELTAYADRQTRDWQALEERVAALEAQVNPDHQPATPTPQPPPHA